MGTVTILLTSVVLATTGQLFLKAGMERIGRIDELGAGALGPLIGKVIVTWQVPFGLIAFALSAVFWLITLSRLPLSTAYPVVSLSYVLILLFSVIVLGERPSATVWIGGLLIMAGIALIGIGQS